MLTAALAFFAMTHQNGTVQTTQTPDLADIKNIYAFKLPDIEGSYVPLGRYKEKVLLVVNVASKCGLTPQYEKLQALHDKYKDRGFTVLGFPANDFKGQEPGTNEEIKQFCTTKYNVSFPMFAKISVLGETAHPLYRWLVFKADRHEPVEWNFAKFLVNKDGQVIARFSPKTAPDALEVTAAIEKALAE